MEQQPHFINRSHSEPAVFIRPRLVPVAIATASGLSVAAYLERARLERRRARRGEPPLKRARTQ